MNELNMPIHPNVNMDIMLAILSHSPPKTATSIMETCRFLYHEGAKVILQQPVFLWGSESQILALLRFIQAEGLSRCSYLRNLVIIIQISERVANIQPGRPSELVAADVNFDFSTHSSAALSHPFHLLQRSVSTLQRLAYTSSGHPDIDNTASQYPQIIYPEVRNLVLGRSGVVPNLTSYI
ncbi:hypothetical protein GSI_07700 [Ganoderma sinense ZZ0214-1]|uniref:Uncharacterized protein n=1 Tax=Ganoderma sinense ZZ0214-1 TaxID=1077348 RepID=A0A2G8S8M2_9APHY|nr:hypothetical protein GSI_07700 [Ganoderma sinense ZZ0214-1]